MFVDSNYQLSHHVEQPVLDDELLYIYIYIYIYYVILNILSRLLGSWESVEFYIVPVPRT